MTEQVDPGGECWECVAVSVDGHNRVLVGLLVREADNSIKPGARAPGKRDQVGRTSAKRPKAQGGDPKI